MDNTLTLELPKPAAVSSMRLLEHPAFDVKHKSNHNELHLFAGAGGGILGGILLGHTTVCAVELEASARQIMLERQADGVLPRFPIWDDIKTFDGRPWRGNVETVCGGFPCQDISYAGRGAGLNGARSGLWGEMRRVVCEIQPRFVFVENSPALTFRGLGRVMADLAAMGYDAEWGVFCSCGSGKLHHRKRIFILADAAKNRRGLLPDANRIRKPRRASNPCDDGANQKTWQTLPAPEFWGGTNGLAGWIQPSWKAVGNGQVPSVAARAWRVLEGEDNMSASARCSNS